MKKFWFLIIIFILILISLTSYYFVFPQVAKKTVYSIDNKSTLYPGFGKITKHVDKYLLVEPIGEGQSFYAPYENKGRYLDFKYKVIEIEEQDKIDYVVGKFKGWEDIENSLDKYILVNYNDTTERWRISFSGLPISSNEATKLGYEDVTLKFNSNEINKIQKSNPVLVSDIGFSKIKDLIKKDDIIVLLPVYEEPILNKRDNGGELMSGWLIIRKN